LKPVRIATRGSKLALWQANHLRDALMQRCGVAADIVVIKTSGDQHVNLPIEQLGMKGVFTKELEVALLDGRADIAIHSMKDVPTELSDVCPALIVFKREDPRDALLSRSGATLKTLSPGSRLGTSSLRRASQLRRVRPDLEIVEIRGNVDSRIRKMDEGEYDGLVLARAGVLRLGLNARITEVISPEIVLPAAGQGALGVQFFEANWDELQFLKKLEDRETMLAVTAERALMAELHGGCRLPLGAWARFENGQMALDACVLSEDGRQIVRGQGVRHCENGREATELGRGVAQEMLAAGADRILQAAGRTVV
jgi:hydroxymethylbilane synthase